MGIDNSSPLPAYIRTLIKVTAAKMKGKYRFTESDLDDIEQTISIEVVRRRGKFDATKAQENTFLAHLVKHAAADIIQKRKASIRDYRREEGSLDEWVLDDMSEWTRRVNTICAQEGRRHLGVSERCEEELRDLSIELLAVLKTLAKPLQLICHHLMRGLSIRETAKACGVHHCTVYKRMQRIGELFIEAGLDRYLPLKKIHPDTFSLVRVDNGGGTHFSSKHFG